MIENQNQLISALARGDHEDLVGAPESDWLEFKSEPYRLDGHRGIADLVADVASFANARGGVIVIGVRTSQPEATQQEVASEVRGVKIGLVSDDQVRKLVRAHIVPLAGITIDRWPVGERELVTITVRAAAVHDHPVIVDRTPDPEGVARSHAFGWPTRDGTDTHWQPSGRIQQLLAGGLRPLADTPPAPVDDQVPPTDLDGFDEWVQHPRLTITARPVRAGHEIDDFYGAFAQELTRWRPVREGGFGLQLGPWVRKEDGMLVASSRRAYLAVQRDGTVFAAANGTPEMLGWALSDRNGVARAWPHVKTMTANPYVVAEYPTELARFVANLIDPAVGGAAWTYTVGGEHLARPIRLDLRPQPAEVGWIDDDAEPITDSFTRPVAARATWQQTAFALVEEIYSSGWGLGRDMVPFASNGAIDQSKMA